MTNFFQRTLLFLIGLPILLFIIIYFDRFSHLGWSFVVVATSALGTVESLSLFVPEPRRWERVLLPLFGALVPVAAVLDYLYGPRIQLMLLAFLCAAFLLLVIRLFTWGGEEISRFTGRTAALLAATIYPALFMAFLVRLAEFPEPLAAVLLFLVLNFGNDTCAYLAGRLFGSRSRHIFSVSPKKTLVGYIGGFGGAVLLGSLFALLCPELFGVAWYWRIPFFLIIAVIADVGDLVESALKRGAEKKDSGKVVPGRGGMLDSIDSLLFSAPFFYYIGLIIFT
jgi:phosphatidate cytidylyltransferase